jgi:DNA-binding XRE family transcriptional regulator
MFFVCSRRVKTPETPSGRTPSLVAPCRVLRNPGVLGGRLSLETRAMSPSPRNPVDHLVGANLRRLRLRKDMTQQVLATKLGVTFLLLKKFESGAARVGAARLAHAAKALGVPIQGFLRSRPGGR